MNDYEKNEIRIGLKKSITLLHITDTHLTLCDERDNPRKQNMAGKRRAEFENAENYLYEQLAYAENNCDLVMHTGDLIDFVSFANVEKARVILRKQKIFYIAGNHDYSQYLGEAWEDAAYRMNSYITMGMGFGVNMFFNSVIFDGVNFVGIDNSYYRVEDWQTERLRLEVQKGFPVILLLHVPVFEESLYEFSMEQHHNKCAYLMGCDEKHLVNFSEYRAAQQCPNESTKRFLNYLNNESAIKATLTGHVHFSFESKLANGATQYVTDAGFRGKARVVTIT